MNDIIRDCTPKEKDALLTFLIGYFLASTRKRHMYITPELATESFIQGRLPVYNTAIEAYSLKAL